MNYTQKNLNFVIFLPIFLMTKITYTMKENHQPPKNFDDLISSTITSNEDLNA
jgi:hypothetical protein